MAQATGRTSDHWRRRLLAWALTGAAHMTLLGALLWLHAAPQAQVKKPAAAAMQVSLLPRPPGPAQAMEAASALPDIAPPPPPAVREPSITIARVAESSDLLSEAQLAGAARAGEGGGGGGGCDLARAVQQALRRDTLVHTAVVGAGRLGKASLLWNGDWVRSGGQDGKGLAAVRQAVLWEVGFAPKACRDEAMHGLVVLSLADGRTRFAIGANDWRWSDLLGLRNPAR